MPRGSNWGETPTKRSKPPKSRKDALQDEAQRIREVHTQLKQDFERRERLRKRRIREP